MQNQSTDLAPDSQALQPLPDTLSDLQSFFLEKYGEAFNLARRSVQVAWVAGRALAEIKARLPHGAFRDWTKDNGLSRSTVTRLMQLQRGDLADLADFVTISAALDSLKPAKALPPAPADTPQNDQFGHFDQPANDPEPGPAVEPEPAVKLRQQAPEPIEAEVVEVEPAQHDVIAYLEAQNAELVAKLTEVKERLAMATAHFSDEAYQTLERINRAHQAEVADLRATMHSKQSNYEAIKRKLGRAKGMLLDGKSADAILADVFHLQRG